MDNESGFRVRPYQRQTDKKQLKLLGLPRKYINQYTNAPPFYFALKALAFLTNFLYVITSSESERIVGTILLRRRLDLTTRRFIWKIHAVYVAPEMRGRGLGTKLMLYATARLREHGAKEVSLKVDEFNDAAIRLYKKCGYMEKRRINNQVVFYFHII